MSQTLDLVVRTFLSISSSNVSFPSTAISSTHCLRSLATWPGRPRGPQRRTLLRRKKNFFDFVKPNFFRLPRVCGPVRASEDVKDVQNVQNSSVQKNLNKKKMIASVALCPAPDWWNPQTDWPWQTLMALMAGSLKKKTGANGETNCECRREHTKRSAVNSGLCRYPAPTSDVHEKHRKTIK